VISRAHWLTFALGVVVACSVDDLPTDTTTNPGLGGSAGSSSDSGADADASLGGTAGDSGVECTILYVSPNGSDTNTGCEKTAPKQTINGALSEAKTTPSATEIHVCKGEFQEQITLDVAVDLRGGYSCVDWTRSSGFGYPTFDGVNESVIVGGTTQEQTVLVTGSSVGAIVDIEGLTIRGPTTPGVEPGVALRIGQEAKPVVSHCRILGGDRVNTGGDGSVGLAAEAQAAPEIHSNDINGGIGATFKSGTTYAASGVGRIGVLVESASPYLHDNRIVGGSEPPAASTGISSVAIVLRNALDLTEAGGRPIRANYIEGGDGDGQLDTIASAGILAFGISSFDLIDSSVRTGKCLGNAVQLRGVHSEATGDIRVLRSRIYGGDLSKELEPGMGFRVGVWVENASSFLAENDMVYGGAAKKDFIGQSPNFAIAVMNVVAPAIRHSTLYSGPSNFPTVGTPVKVNGNVTGLQLQNNILAADAHWNETLYVEPCASLGTFERVENNLMFNFGVPGAALQVFGYGPDPQGACSPWQDEVTIDEMTAHLQAVCSASTSGACAGFGGTKVSGNRTLRQSCGTDSGCIPWPACGNESLPCLESVFADWSDQDNGLSSLFGDGWKLGTIPCALTKSSLNVGVTTDLFGVSRTNEPSMGAHEQDDTCSP
jgi:hypothetical protein